MNQHQIQDEFYMQQLEQQLTAAQNFNQVVLQGRKELVNHFSTHYPRQSHSHEIREPLKFLTQGGTDPLLFYIYKNDGNPNVGIPRHWHYIGLGLSDIHGYHWCCRLNEFANLTREQDPSYAHNPPQNLPELYPPPTNNHVTNGYGFELTFRLKCDSDDEWQQKAPEWPQQLMQELALYVFQYRNIFKNGDHCKWDRPLDGETSEIKHILLTLDPQLGIVQNLPLGPIEFIQIVGVCEEELQSARQWNVKGILEMMKRSEATGGPLLVTDMRRNGTIFSIDPNNNSLLDEGIKATGSNMVQLCAKHKLSYIKPQWFIEAEEMQRKIIENHNNEDEERMLEDTTASILNNMPEDVNQCMSTTMNKDENNMNSFQEYSVRASSRMSQGSESNLKIENAALVDERSYDNIYILLSHESAKVLPIMMNGRLSHKQHFSFQCFNGGSLITFLPEGCQLASLVSPQKPYVRKGHWLQIYVSEELCKQMSESLSEDFSKHSPRRKLRLPKNYSWSEFNLHLTVVDEL